MGIFNFGKKKQKETACGCSNENETNTQKVEEEMAMSDCGSMCPVSEIEAKKAAEKKGSNCCGNIDAQSVDKAKEDLLSGASVKVLGSGCKKCNDLESATKEALESLGMDTTIDHVTDFAAIASFGVMTTPALVIDGKVVSYGKVLKVSEVVEILKKVRA